MNWTETILQAVEERVKHDKPTTAMVLFTYVSRLTENPLNLFLRGSSGIGKTYNVTETIKILSPDENENPDIWWLGGLSPTALVHSYGVLMSGNEPLDMNERPQRPRRGDFTNKEDYQKELLSFNEKIKEWREKLQNSYYIVDLSGKMLVFLEAPHIDTYNKLRPLLSHDKKRISYRFTDKTGKGELRTMHVILEGWPSTICCTTEEKYLEDLATRSFTVTPNLSIEKVKLAMALTAQDFSLPRTNRIYENIQTQLSQVGLRDFNNLQILIPYAKILAEKAIFFAHRVMRDFNHFLQLLTINAILNFQARPRLTVGEREFLLATLSDLEEVRDIWKSIEETTLTGVSGTSLDIFTQLMKPFGEMIFNYGMLVERSKKIYPSPLSSSSLRKYCQVLQDVGLIDIEPDPEDKRRKVIKIIGEEKNMWNYEITEFPSFFTLESLKAWLNDVKKLCATNTNLSHTFFNNTHEITMETLWEVHYSHEGNPLNRTTLGSGESKTEKITDVKTDFLPTIQSQESKLEQPEEPQKTPEITNPHNITQFEPSIRDSSLETKTCENCGAQIPPATDYRTTETGVLCSTCARAKQGMNEVG